MDRKKVWKQAFTLVFAMAISTFIYYLGWRGGYDHGYILGYAEISSAVAVDTVESQRREIDAITSGVRRTVNCEDGPESIIFGTFLAVVEGMKEEILDLRKGSMELALERDALRRKLELRVKAGK